MPLAVVNIESELCDQRVVERELGDGKARNCELAEAEQSNPKLRNGHNPKGKLPDDVWFLRPQEAQGSALGLFDQSCDTWHENRVCGTFKEREGWHGCQMPVGVLRSRRSLKSPVASFWVGTVVMSVVAE